MILKNNTMITTNHLRSAYENNSFSFGNSGASSVICLVGSCRIVPILNYLRAYNELNGHPFELLCFNPVEMWRGVGTDVGDCATELLKNYRFGKVDFLVSEHTVRCGALNTVAGTTPNIFDTLGCNPSLHVRLPNWNNMHIFDAETAMWDASYANLAVEERVRKLKQQSDLHKSRFISYCQQCSFPEITDWVESEWLTTRMGWSSNHPSLPLIWRIFNGVAGKLGITITPELAAHPMCVTDVYASTGIPLNKIDYEANNWKY